MSVTEGKTFSDEVVFLCDGETLRNCTFIRAAVICGDNCAIIGCGFFLSENAAERWKAQKAAQWN